jgi:hypothetical protein
MEPYSAYTMVDALLDNLDRHIWRSRDHDTVNFSGYGSDLAVTPGPLHVRGVWVDGKHFVPRASQLAEHGVGCLVRLAGDAGHGETPSPKKCRDRFRSSSHDTLPIQLAQASSQCDASAVPRPVRRMAGSEKAPGRLSSGPIWKRRGSFPGPSGLIRSGGTISELDS